MKCPKCGSSEYGAKQVIGGSYTWWYNYCLVCGHVEKVKT